MLSHNELQRIYNTLFKENIKSGISDFLRKIWIMQSMYMTQEFYGKRML